MANDLHIYIDALSWFENNELLGFDITDAAFANGINDTLAAVIQKVSSQQIPQNKTNTSQTPAQVNPASAMGSAGDRNPPLVKPDAGKKTSKTQVPKKKADAVKKVYPKPPVDKANDVTDKSARKIMKSFDGTDLILPGVAKVEYFREIEIFPDLKIKVAPDDAVQSFTIGTKKYVAKFDKDNKFLGYFSDAEMKDGYKQDPKGVDAALEKAEELMYTPYEFGGKHPIGEFLDLLSYDEGKDWWTKNLLGDLHAISKVKNDKDATYAEQTKKAKEVYEKFGLKYSEALSSIGIDCSGFLAMCYNQDKTLLMDPDELNKGGTITQLGKFRDEAENDNAIVYEQKDDRSYFNFLSKGDAIYYYKEQKNKKRIIDHVAMATGRVKLDRDGNVAEYETVESYDTDKGVLHNQWRDIKDGGVIAHPFRTTDVQVTNFGGINLYGETAKFFTLLRNRNLTVAGVDKDHKTLEEIKAEKAKKEADKKAKAAADRSKKDATKKAPKTDKKTDKKAAPAKAAKKTAASSASSKLVASTKTGPMRGNYIREDGTIDHNRYLVAPEDETYATDAGAAKAAGGTEPKKLGKNDVSEFGHGNNTGRNFNHVYYSTAPGQTTLWYNDYKEYDVIEIWIPNPNSPSDEILLWTTGQSDDAGSDGRAKDRSGFYMGTMKDPQFKDEESDLDRTNYSNIPQKGWGSYTLPASVTKFRIKVYANNAPGYTFENRLNPSIWLFYLRNARDKPPKKKKPGEQESHSNTRYLVSKTK